MCYYIDVRYYNSIYSANGENMKILSIILRILIVISTCIWGVACGVLFPLVILLSDGSLINPEIANHHVIPVWLIVSLVGYVLPAAFILCRRYKLAAGFSLAGLVGVLYVYAKFAELYVNTPDSNGPTELYLPCIFITIGILVLAVIENRQLIFKKFEQHSEKKNAAAPSILSDERKEK